MRLSDWSLEITRVENGYRLRHTNADGAFGWTESVIQDGDGIESAEALLWAVLDHFSLAGTKHDAERVAVCREFKDHIECRGEEYWPVSD